MKRLLIAGVTPRIALGGAILLSAAAPALGAGQPLASASGTSDKPQSKIWYNDGSYWAVLQQSDGSHIFRLQAGSWSEQGFIDSQVNHGVDGREDVLWNGSELFVLVYSAGDPALYKYTYVKAAQQYALLTGFPVHFPIAAGSETIVLAQDSSGRLWATYEGGGDVHVAYTTTADHRTWQSPGVVLRSGINDDDISTIAAFGGNKIGVFWSDQNRWEFGFRVHQDGDSPDLWSSVEVVYPGGGNSDDHINLATDPTGRVFAITKDASNKFAVHRRNLDGTWTTRADIANGQDGTRPVLMLDPGAKKLYALYTCWTCGGSDPIQYRVGSTETLAFGSPTTFLTGPVSLNDVTDMKQMLPSGSMLAIAAGGGTAYWNGWGDPPAGNGFGGTLPDSIPVPPPPPPPPLLPPARVAARSAVRTAWPGVVATFPFDERTGQEVVNSSDAAIGGTLGQPGQGDVSEPQRVPGRQGGALGFDGANDFVTVSDAPELGFAGSFTLEAWVRRTTSGTTDAILAKEGAGRNYRLRLLSAGLVELAWKDAAGTSHSTTSVHGILDTNWHHVAAVHDQEAGVDRLYVDGALDRTRADTAAPAPCADALLLGARTSSRPRDFFHGDLDLVRLAARALYTQSFVPPAGFVAPPPVPYVRLDWPVASSTQVAGYLVYRGTNAEPFEPLTLLPVTGSCYGDSQPVDGVLCYRVKAVDRSGVASVASVETCLTYGNGPTPPPQPPAPLAKIGRETLPPLGNAAFLFDEGRGSLASDAFHGLQATLGSASQRDASEPTWVAGVAGSALKFDGLNDYVDVADQPLVRFDASFTLEAWVCRASGTAYGVLLCKESSSGRNYRLALAATGSLELSWTDAATGSVRSVQSGATVPEGTWHHVAGVLDRSAGESRLYLDGQLVGRAPTPGAPQTGTQRLRLGARASTSGSPRDPFSGGIDIVRLTPSALYAAPFTPPTEFPARQIVVNRVRWSPALQGSARIASYEVQRSIEGGEWVRLGSRPATELEWRDFDPPAGSACYRFASVDLLGLMSEASPTACALAQSPLPWREPLAPALEPRGLQLAVAPNPFNPATQVLLHLDAPAPVEARVYDVAGRLVRTLALATLPAGDHRFPWNGRDARNRAVPSGVYFLRLRAGAESQIRKLVLAK